MARHFIFSTHASCCKPWISYTTNYAVIQIRGQRQGTCHLKNLTGEFPPPRWWRIMSVMPTHRVNQPIRITSFCALRLTWWTGELEQRTQIMFVRKGVLAGSGMVLTRSSVISSNSYSTSVPLSWRKKHIALADNVAGSICMSVIPELGIIENSRNS